MDDVGVSYGSPHPAQLGARAFARGTEIHLAPGAEGELAHEAWHVVQQKRGAVRPTFAVGGEAANADRALEREADVMGAQAERAGAGAGAPERSPGAASAGPAVARPVVQGRWLIIPDRAQYFWDHEPGVDKGDVELPWWLATHLEIDPPEGEYVVDGEGRRRGRQKQQFTSYGAMTKREIADAQEQERRAAASNPQTQITVLVATVEGYLKATGADKRKVTADQYNPFGRFATSAVSSFVPAGNLEAGVRDTVLQKLREGDKTFRDVFATSTELTTSGYPQRVKVAVPKNLVSPLRNAGHAIEDGDKVMLAFAGDGPFGAGYALTPAATSVAQITKPAQDLSLLGIAGAGDDVKIAHNYRIGPHDLKAMVGQKRVRSQAQVMGASAGDAVANAGYDPREGKGWEWLHLIAHSMGGITGQGPQVAGNLVAGTSECNTQMIIVEEFIKDHIERWGGYAALVVSVRMHDAARHIGAQINYDFELYNATDPAPVAVYHWHFDPLSRDQPLVSSNRLVRTAGRAVHEDGGTPATKHVPRSEPTAHRPYMAVDALNTTVDNAVQALRSLQPAGFIAYLRTIQSPRQTIDSQVLDAIGDVLDLNAMNVYLPLLRAEFGDRTVGRVVYSFDVDHRHERVALRDQVVIPMYGSAEAVPDAVARYFR